MRSYEVVIVGGGPAGASLGYMLVKAGFSVCIIERERFPRFKLCGGLLTEKSVRLFEKIYGEKIAAFRIRTDVPPEISTRTRFRKSKVLSLPPS